jgi:hypothetical protein
MKLFHKIAFVSLVIGTAVPSGFGLISPSTTSHECHFLWLYRPFIHHSELVQRRRRTMVSLIRRPPPPRPQSIRQFFLQKGLQAKKSQEYGEQFIDETLNPEEEAVTDQLHETDRENDNQGDDDERIIIDVDTVSDAEALLACRAYLQHRNRLQGGWEQFEQRKTMRNFQSTQRSSYFWEDPSELVFLKDDNDDENDNENDDDENDYENGPWHSEPSSWEDQESGIVVFDNTNNDGSATNDLGKEFTTFPLQPSKTRILRSQAALRTWQDDEWKKKWHERRWGNKTKNNDDESKQRKAIASHQKQLEKRVRAIPPGLLGSPELAALSESEIAEAIRTYLVFQKKYSVSWSKTKAQQKAVLHPPPHAATNHQARLSRDNLLKQDESALQNARRLRGERAKLYYRARLQNKAAKEATTTKTTSRTTHNKINGKTTTNDRKTLQSETGVPQGVTGKDALRRIEAHLDQGAIPTTEDIELLLKPSMLGGRKELLLRILRDVFDLRGKCIPANLNNYPDQQDNLVFATQCAYATLGKFVLFKLRQKASNNIMS